MYVCVFSNRKQNENEMATTREEEAKRFSRLSISCYMVSFVSSFVRCMFLFCWMSEGISLSHMDMVRFVNDEGRKHFRSSEGPFFGLVLVRMSDQIDAGRSRFSSYIRNKVLLQALLRIEQSLRVFLLSPSLISFFHSLSVSLASPVCRLGSLPLSNSMTDVRRKQTRNSKTSKENEWHRAIFWRCSFEFRTETDSFSCPFYRFSALSPSSFSDLILSFFLRSLACIPSLLRSFYGTDFVNNTGHCLHTRYHLSTSVWRRREKVERLFEGEREWVKDSEQNKRERKSKRKSSEEQTEKRPKWATHDHRFKF